MKSTISAVGDRTRQLNSVSIREGPVVYWMSRDQRTIDNYALLFAQLYAISKNQPLLVVFNMLPEFLGAGWRQYAFMIEGLKNVEADLSKKNIPFTILFGQPRETIPSFLNNHKAGALITDFDPLRIKREWKQQVINEISIPVFETDTHNLVPCWIASNKQEYGAYTLRPKINSLLPQYLIEIPQIIIHPVSYKSELLPLDWNSIEQKLTVDRSVSAVEWIHGGQDEAVKKMKEYIQSRFHLYGEHCNDPVSNSVSFLSPYIHFGHLSAQRIALTVDSEGLDDQSKMKFLEQLIIRKELSDNFCYYNDNYDTPEGFPNWAYSTLEDHLCDKREYHYSLRQFENAETHDPLWNAAQMEMVKLGRMHNYLRMYWAKKILEWTFHFAEAQQIAINLNDKYQLDGRDPNGYTGIAWSIGGVHDRAWSERSVFGKVRYMNYNGCKRKFDVQKYIENVNMI